MHVKSIVLLLASGLFISCNAKRKKPAPAVEKNGTDTLIHCYGYTGNGDTVWLTLAPGDSERTGTLLYDLEGKDKNTGTIRGQLQKELLIANYTFMSEGVQSVRQVIFKLKENYLVEGFGEIVTRNDSVFFRNIDSLQYNDAMKLTKRACQ